MKCRWASLLVLLVPSLLLAVEQANLFEAVVVSGRTIKIQINEKFSQKYLTSDLFWITYEEDIPLENLGYEILTLPALLNLHTLVWFSGDVYYVDAMDTDVYASLQKLQAMIRLVYPKSPWRGDIRPRKLVDRSQDYAYIHKNNRRGMLFSGGLDSHSSYYDHFQEPLHLITGQGHADLSLKRQAAFDSMKDYVKGVVQQGAHGCSFFRSNYFKILNRTVIRELYPSIVDWRFCTMEGMTWMGLVAPILIAKQCSALYIAAGRTWEYNVAAMANPFADDSIRFAGFSLIHDQFDKSRYDKTCLVVDKVREHKLKRPFLKVCLAKADTVCGKCRKCVMLMVHLLALGESLRDYGFELSDEEAVEAMVARCKRTILHKEAYQIIDTQKKMRRDCRNFPKRLAVLEPFLSFDPYALSISWKTTDPIAWERLQAFAPSVTIPNNLVTLFPCKNAYDALDALCRIELKYEQEANEKGT